MPLSILPCGKGYLQIHVSRGSAAETEANIIEEIIITSERTKIELLVMRFFTVIPPVLIISLTQY